MFPVQTLTPLWGMRMWEESFHPSLRPWKRLPRQLLCAKEYLWPQAWPVQSQEVRTVAGPDTANEM